MKSLTPHPQAPELGPQPVHWSPMMQAQLGLLAQAAGIGEHRGGGGDGAPSTPLSTPLVVG